MKNINWKPFWLSLIVLFIVVTLKNIGFRLPIRLLRLAPAYRAPKSKEIILQEITPKLRLKIDTFELRKSFGFIETSYASSISDELSAYAIIDFDSGSIIEEKALTKRLPIASLTKIMTAVIALDLAKKGDAFVASEFATAVEPTRMGIVAGERLKIEELLNGLLLLSANDAAEVLKEGIDNMYGQPIFIDAMNMKAKILGLSHTCFDNPQGYDGNCQYSSISDLVILSHYAFKNYPLISEIIKKEYLYISANSVHGEYKLVNWNGLLGVYPGVFGIKIGNTDGAGHTTAVVAARGGKRILVVLLGASGILKRDMLASLLLNRGFEKAYGYKPIEITEEMLKNKYASWPPLYE